MSEIETSGAHLKKIRLEKGLSLEEAQKKTRIHPNILRAIEEDSLVNFSPVYIKGFLKIYCKFLGVDPKDYIPDYREAARPIHPVEEKAHPAHFLKREPKKVFFLLSRIKIKTILIASVLLILIVGLFNLGKIISSRKPRSLPVATKLPAAISAKVERKNSADLERIPAAAVIRLGMHTRENCYISIKTDGRLVFQGILKKGMSESWQAKNKIELSLSNAGAVELQINDKLIRNVGRKGQAIKGILVTKEGLSIPR